MSEYLDLTTGSRFKVDPRETFGLAILMGLTSEPKNIPPMYFYDAKGSELFQKIMGLDEYYPTQCEAEILTNSAGKIANVLGSSALNIIELGAGDGAKTKILLSEFERTKKNVRYFPIDISEDALRELNTGFTKDFPNIPVKPVIAEYYEGLRWLNQNTDGRNLVLFLGSNIGNFSNSQALVFLKTLWNTLNDGDYVLLGCDLKKDIDVMLAAYNDSQGVTDEFNLNLLTRMNSELRANFDLSKFRHFGTYNVKMGAMESFLISTESQDVYISYLDRSFHFKPFEPIHCEYSMKYLPSEIIEMVGSSGFKVVDIFTDKKSYFADALIQVCKGT